MSTLFSSRPIALAITAALAAISFAAHARAFETCCGPDEGPSWVFAPGTYTHDPMTGARVAQYERKTPVEPLEDERNVTSGYRRTYTIRRGTDGSSDINYQVQNWGNGRGGLDAEWECFHDAWKESYLTGGSYSYPAYGYGYGSGYGYGPGYGNGPGYGYGGPGYGNGGPSWGGGTWNGPPNGGNGPGNWNGPGNGGPPNGIQGGNGSNDSPQGNWHHGNHGQDE
jgi:hypothetical protein